MPDPAASNDLMIRAARVTALVLDVDGVLTDGRVIYDEFGDELKCFDVQDGAGLALWRKAGLRIALISGRKSRSLKRRAKEMRVDFLAQGTDKKLAMYEKFIKKFHLAHAQVCAIGDDLMDLPILKRAGLSVAVPGAVEEVKTISHYVTLKSGGRGSVREVVDMILKAKGLWDSALQPYRI